MGERVGREGVNTEIELLRSEHDSLEKRLADLERHISLTPTEQVERARIKKWKLRLKDRITALAGQGSGRGGSGQDHQA